MKQHSKKRNLLTADGIPELGELLWRVDRHPNSGGSVSDTRCDGASSASSLEKLANGIQLLHRKN